MARVTKLNVNGREHEIDADAEATLLSVIRGHLELTGTKYGCGEGQCAACTVLIDGYARHSCQIRVGEVDQRKVTTIEGLEKGGELHPVQQAFIDVDAMQCAYCTSGMILGAVSFLERNPHPSRAEIVEFMNPHLCRCGTYQRIVEAISLASTRMRAKKEKAS